GVTGLETAFASLLTGLVEPGVLPLATVVTAMTVAPARAFALPEPRLAVGEPAGLALWDLAGEWTVRPDTFQSRSANSAFLGRRLRGRCHLTVAGYVLLEDGRRFDGEAGSAPGVALGEVVFTTGMTGYQESLTDPSFAGQ